MKDFELRQAVGMIGDGTTDQYFLLDDLFRVHTLCLRDCFDYSCLAIFSPLTVDLPRQKRTFIEKMQSFEIIHHLNKLLSQSPEPQIIVC